MYKNDILHLSSLGLQLLALEIIFLPPVKRHLKKSMNYIYTHFT